MFVKRGRVKKILIVVIVGFAGWLFYSINYRPFWGVDRYVKLYTWLKNVDKEWTSRFLSAPAPQPFRYLDKKILDEKVKNPPSWVRAQIDRGFDKYARYDEQLIVDTFNKLPKDNFVLFSVANGKVSYQNKGEYINGAVEYALQFYANMLEHLVQHQYLKELKFIIRFTDTTSGRYEGVYVSDIAPILAVTMDSRKPFDQDAILIPDWMNFESWPKQRVKIAWASKQHPWKKKINTVLWRGGEADVTGYRHAVVELSRQLEYKKIDAQFTYGDQSTIKYLPPQKQVPYKYLLTIDGHTAAWERPVWQLYSNSVMLKQRSDLIQWFYPELKPNVHYVELDNDPATILPTLERYTDDQLQEIARNGQRFAEQNLTPEDITAYFILVVQEYQNRMLSKK